VQRCENKIEEVKKEIMKEIEFKKQVEGQLEAVILERKKLEKELNILMNQFEQEKKQQEEKFGNLKIKFQTLYFQETGNDLDFYKDLRLDLDCINKNIVNLINKMNQENLKVPNIKRLNFMNPPKDDRELLNFLSF
jgi:predicted nuclease with TOPRIM domain